MAMASTTGALATLLPKLAQLLQDEYKLQKRVRKNIKILKKELEHTHAALRAVGKVPLEQLSEQVKLWAQDARELSYDMEDVVDTFLVRVEGHGAQSRSSSRKFIKKMNSFLAVYKRHQVGEQIKDINERVKDLAKRRDRYKVDTITRGAATVDPRIAHLYTKATDLVGIDEAKKELGTLLDQQRIVSIVGFGGLGKTTLAKALYAKIKPQFNCTAFVVVSQNPDMKKFLNDLLHELGQGAVHHNKSLDEKQLIDTAIRFLHDRRLSLQQGKRNGDMNQATQSMQLVRSVVAFPSTGGQMSTFRSFKVLRVLDLQGCDLSEQGYTLQHLGCLFHLRYLSLNRTQIDQLPESVGNLQYLEILDVCANKISQLPKCVARLTRLLHLVFDWETRISNGIGSLTFLEKLSYLNIDDESVDNIHSLGLLTKLRVLRIILRTDKCIDNPVESLCKLPKIQELLIDVHVDDHQRFMGILDAWIAPQQLCQLYLWNTFFFSTLPAWLKNIMQYQDLTHLFIGVRELQQEDLEILGRLPALYHLYLRVGHKDLGIIRKMFFTIGGGWFPCHVFCELWGFLWPVRFQQGPMPGVRQLTFDFHEQEATEIAAKDDGFELGLENLL